ncbi:MAG: hypothetical protein GY841_13755 [FCB group bacterium]|nr:hypothetical protein [FCB group bacterium]
MTVRQGYFSLKSIALKLFFLLFVFLILVSYVVAEDRVTPGFSNYCMSPHYYDTIWVNINYTLDFIIENDALLKDISLGFRIYSPDDATWEWLSAENGYGPEGWNSGMKLGQIKRGCRMDPAEMVWDVSDLRIIEQDMDGFLPDSFLIFGEADTAGLEPGWPEKMISMSCRVGGPSGDGVRTICIDTAVIPPDGDWLFVDDQQQNIVPVFDYGQPHCWAVKMLPNCCGWPWAVCSSAPKEINHCGSGDFYVEVYNYTGDPRDLYIACHNGEGVTSISHEGASATITYYAAESDCGHTVDIPVWASDPFSCVPFCPNACILHAVVTNNAPTLDVGVDGMTGYDMGFIKTDIIGSDIDTCDDLTYGMVSGPGTIDPETGVYTWLPSIGDAGFNTITVEVTDGFDAIMDDFIVEVFTCTGRCAAGDVNFDGDVNVGDAVAIINVVFKGAPYPQVPDMADANADCALNVGDAVFLINYVFKNGDPPQMGCVY